MNMSTINMSSNQNRENFQGKDQSNRVISLVFRKKGQECKKADLYHL